MKPRPLQPSWKSLTYWFDFILFRLFVILMLVFWSIWIMIFLFSSAYNLIPLLVRVNHKSPVVPLTISYKQKIQQPNKQTLCWIIFALCFFFFFSFLSFSSSKVLFWYLYLSIHQRCDLQSSPFAPLVEYFSHLLFLLPFLKYLTLNLKNFHFSLVRSIVLSCSVLFV